MDHHVAGFHVAWSSGDGRRSVQIMAKGYRLKGTVGSGNNVDPDDVWVLKHALHRNGFYSTPSDGITPYQDSDLFDSIQQFQVQNELRADGVVAPGGQTEYHMRPLLITVTNPTCVPCKAWTAG